MEEDDNYEHNFNYNCYEDIEKKRTGLYKVL